MQDRMTEMEIKLAHLEAALNELSDTVYAQQGHLDQLGRMYLELQQRLATGDSPGTAATDDERPPHY